MKNRNPLETRDAREVNRLFPEYKKLFDFVAKLQLPADSFSAYIGQGRSKYTPIILPEQFHTLTQDHPGSYFVVGYEDRRDDRNAQGTRGRWVRLSTVQRKAETDDRVREVDITEVDPSEGNVIEMKVTESVMNKGREGLMLAGDEELNESSGSARFVYRIDPQGKKEVRDLVFDRLDEGMFQFGDAQKAVRWVRKLEVSKDVRGLHKTTYQDYYIVGRSNDVRKEEVAQITTDIGGTLESPTSILVQIGSGRAESGQVLYQDKDAKCRVIVHAGFNSTKNQLEIAKTDPMYAPLFAPPVDAQEFVRGIVSRITMLKDEWDKPQSVYASTTSIEKDQGLLP